MDEEDKLIIGMVVCMTLFFLAMVWVVYYPGKPKYVINYEQPSTISELPYKLFEDPPIEKELGDWTMKFYEVPKGEIKLTEREELAGTMTYYMDMELTAYEYTGCCTADGSWPVAWYTVASNDPALWHKRIWIEGYGEFWVCDTGGMASSVLDIYLGDYSSCIQFGRRYASVYIIEE